MAIDRPVEGKNPVIPPDHHDSLWYMIEHHVQDVGALGENGFVEQRILN
jgi:hypothetical protein